MLKDSHFFDDITKLAGGMAGTVADMKREIEGALLGKTEKLLSRMNLVNREEFEVVRALAETARAEQEALLARLDALENELHALRAKKK